MNEKNKEKIRMQLEVLDLSNAENKLLVVKTNISDKIEMGQVVHIFRETIKDMGLQLRVAFVPEEVTAICQDCPKATEIKKMGEEDKGELIQGKTKLNKN